MKSTQNMKLITNDNLIARWQDHQGSGKIFTQRKRLSNSTSQEMKDIQTLYAVSVIHYLRTLRNTYGMSIKEGMTLLNKYRIKY